MLNKRSFVELPLELDVAALQADVASLPPEAWRTTYWGTPHCSVAMTLLRGGTQGDPQDFTCEEVADQPVLAHLPAIRGLLAHPFAGCRYAFLFRMEPHGVSLAHADGAEVWHGLHRVHVPLTTHPAAVLVVEGRACHLAPGRAWTFNNQSLHGFANGPTERTHLILDVPPSPTFDALLQRGTVHPGVIDPGAAARTLERQRGVTPYPGDAVIDAQLRALAGQGWSPRDLLAWLEYHHVPHRTHGATWTVEGILERLAGSEPPAE